MRNEWSVPVTVMHRAPLVRRWQEIYRSWAVESFQHGGLSCR